MGVSVLICSLSDQQLFQVVGSSPQAACAEHAVLFALVALYDQRGGGIETSFKGDKGGMGLTKRNKKRFEAQQMVMLLGSLAHNVVVWAQAWLTSPPSPQNAQRAEPAAQGPTALRHYGLLRMVLDVFHVSGFLCLAPGKQVVEIVLNQDAPLARLIIPALRELLAPTHVVINLGQT